VVTIYIHQCINKVILIKYYCNRYYCNRSGSWCNSDETYDIWHCNTYWSTGVYHAWWCTNFIWWCCH